MKANHPTLRRLVDLLAPPPPIADMQVAVGNSTCNYQPAYKYPSTAMKTSLEVCYYTPGGLRLERGGITSGGAEIILRDRTLDKL